MALIANASPRRIANGETLDFLSLFSCPGSAGDLVKVWGKGTVSCVRTAAGKYTLTFQTLPNATIVDFSCTAYGVSGTPSPIVFSQIVKSTSINGVAKVELYTATVDTATPSATQAITKTLADPVVASTTHISFCVTYAKSTTLSP